MTTFQAVIYGTVTGFSEFLPISATGHQALLPYLLGWEAPSVGFLGALNLGALLSVLVYFRHDWASIISCFLQCVIFRKKLMTLDERLPLFILISTLPIGGAWFYFHERLAGIEWTIPIIAAFLASTGILLAAAQYMGRNTKGLFDWNWLDCLWVGFAQLLGLIPGAGGLTGALACAYFRNYKSEAASKYVFLANAPLLAATAAYQLRELTPHASVPLPDMSWLSLAMAAIVTFFAGLLAIGGFMKHIERQKMTPYAVYRVLLATSVLAVYWLRSH